MANWVKIEGGDRYDEHLATINGRVCHVYSDVWGDSWYLNVPDDSDCSMLLSKTLEEALKEAEEEVSSWDPPEPNPE